MPYKIYAGLKSLIKKIDGCAKNTEKSLTTKIDDYIPLSKHILYHGEDCNNLHFTKRTWYKCNYFWKEGNVTINKKKNQNHIKMQQYVTFVEKDFQKNFRKIKIIKMLETIAILQVNTVVQRRIYATYPPEKKLRLS